MHANKNRETKKQLELGKTEAEVSDENKKRFMKNEEKHQKLERIYKQTKRYRDRKGKEEKKR